MTTLFKKLRDLGFAEAHAATNAAVDLRAPDVVDQHVRNLEGHEDNMRRGLIELRTQIQVAEERSRKLASDYALANGRAQSLLTKAKAADPSRKVQLEQAARL